jgi:hypothetical protein
MYILCTSWNKKAMETKVMDHRKVFLGFMSLKIFKLSISFSTVLASYLYID